MSADLLIVGGSFAGLACARTAAARGLRVRLIDRKPDAGAFVRTTGILVKEVIANWDVPAAYTRTITGVRLYAPSGRWIDLTSPGYYFAATDTAGLLRWMAGQATALGATCAWGTGFAGAVRRDAGWQLVGTGGRTRVLVGADGPNSAVARACGLGRNRAFLRGAEAEVVGLRGVAPDRLHCFLDRRLAPGYLAWVVPGVRVTHVGLACRPPARPDLRALLTRVGRCFDAARARVVARRGGLIPVGGPVRPVAAPGVLLVGDAAGQVSPLTAGGIHTALDHGRALAHVVADQLCAGGPPAHVAVARIQPRFRFKRWLRRLADWGPPDRLVEAVIDTPPLRALAATIFFHHRGWRSAAAWRDLVRCFWGARAPASR